MKKTTVPVCVTSVIQQLNLCTRYLLSREKKRRIFGEGYDRGVIPILHTLLATLKEVPISTSDTYAHEQVNLQFLKKVEESLFVSLQKHGSISFVSPSAVIALREDIIYATVVITYGHLWHSYAGGKVRVSYMVYVRSLDIFSNIPYLYIKMIEECRDHASLQNIFQVLPKK